jgi:ATP-dependent exoDNAse (exonuclease V) beta subunit
MQDTSEIKALLHLLDDPDEEIYQTVSTKLKRYGKEIIPNLESFGQQTSNIEVHEKIVHLIHDVNFKDVFKRFKKWFTPLRELADRLPAWEVISQIMADSDLLLNLATRQERRKRIENVRKLLVMAAAKPELNALEYATMIEEIERLSDAELDPSIVDQSDDLITTITIHNSKGLEWPVVIVADAMLHKPFPLKPPMFEADRGWFAFWLPRANTYSSEFIKEQEKANRAAELLRLQYVAMTRAKRKLILVGWEGNRAGLIEPVRSSIGSAAFSSMITTVVTPE